MKTTMECENCGCGWAEYTDLGNCLCEDCHYCWVCDRIVPVEDGASIYCSDECEAKDEKEGAGEGAEPQSVE